MSGSPPAQGALTRAFERGREERRALLVGYLPAGFPSYGGSVEALLTLVENGVDVLEVGLPYSDPLIDGPTVQAGVDRALAGGTTPARVLTVVEQVARLARVPVVVMTYWNPIERYGAGAFARDLAAAGGVGVITPDLTPEEADGWLAEAARHGLDPVFLVAPSSTDARLRLVADTTRGFVYAASAMAVTGARSAVGPAAPELVARVRAVTDLPVGVGLGVSTGEQAAEVASYADGVIVGSAFVRALLEAPDPAAGLDRLGRLAEELAAGVRAAR